MRQVMTRKTFWPFDKLIQLLLPLLLCALAMLSTTARAEEIIYFVNDPSGSPVLATDAAGNVVWKEYYRPYGKRLDNEAASVNNKLWFAGKPYDNDTGLSYFGARYYDPLIGRFMGIDPQGFDPGNLHSFNRYAYGNNNPNRYVDPDGRTSQSVLTEVEEGGGRVGSAESIMARGLDGGPRRFSLEEARANLQQMRAEQSAGEAATGGSTAKTASELPVVKPGTKEWNAAANALSNTAKGKINLRTETASDAKALLKEGRGSMDRQKQYTTDQYRKGYEAHNQQNARELGVGNDLQHLKWKDGKAGGHIYYDVPN